VNSEFGQFSATQGTFNLEGSSYQGQIIGGEAPARSAQSGKAMNLPEVRPREERSQPGKPAIDKTDGSAIPDKEASLDSQRSGASLDAFYATPAKAALAEAPQKEADAATVRPSYGGYAREPASAEAPSKEPEAASLRPAHSSGTKEHVTTDASVKEREALRHGGIDDASKRSEPEPTAKRFERSLQDAAAKPSDAPAANKDERIDDVMRSQRGDVPAIARPVEMQTDRAIAATAGQPAIDQRLGATVAATQDPRVTEDLAGSIGPRELPDPRLELAVDRLGSWERWRTAGRRVWRPSAWATCSLASSAKRRRPAAPTASVHPLTSSSLAAPGRTIGPPRSRAFSIC
jgi:hypothetical protein